MSAGATVTQADRDAWRAMTGYHDCCGMSRIRGHHDLCPHFTLAHAKATAAAGGV